MNSGSGGVLFSPIVVLRFGVNLDKREILHTYFGYDDFRSGQEQLVDSILNGRDCLGVMPTGAGKSLCFQVPALMMTGTAIVISPLISLMQDQVNALLRSGVNAACINSGTDYYTNSEIYSRAYAGEFKLLYVAPERLNSAEFLRLCNEINIPLVAVDEAHCVSRWGQDFRPSYLEIPRFIGRLRQRPVIAAFTATATAQVKQDIVQMLEMRDPFTLTLGYDRPNLYFEVRRSDSKDSELLKILRDNYGSAIVYCATRKAVEAVCGMLVRNEVKAVMYHAGLDQEIRRQSQLDFQYDRADVIVATNAFGMGIDKSNVSLVVHYNMPMDPESYYQEAGRAGRDGSPARCILLFEEKDVSLAQYIIDNSHDEQMYPDTSERELLKERDRERLNKMAGYCRTGRCLREYILNYFGEKAPCNCSNCGNCNGKGTETLDITVEAQKILSCVFRLKQRDMSGSRETVCGILLGRRGKGFESFETLSTYGIMKDYDAAKLYDIFDYLVKNGYIENRETCVLTEKSDEFIKSNGRLLMKRNKSKSAPAAEVENPVLFERLKAQRKKFSTALGVPPYVILSDASLRDMCAKLPRNITEMYSVYGIGTIKAERYGDKFLRIINSYLSENLSD